MKIPFRIPFFRKKNSKSHWKSTTRKQSTLFDNERSGAFFQRRRKHSTVDFKKSIGFLKEQKLVLSIFWIVFSLMLGIFLIYGPFFWIQEIYIEDEKNISNINQAYDSIDYIRGTNLLFVDTQKLSNRIRKNQATIKDIQVDLKFPSTLKVSISSYTPIFQTERFIIYENGSVGFSENTSIDIPSLKVSEDLEEISIFWKTLRANDLNKIRILLEDIEKNILSFSKKTLYYLPVERELIIENSVGTLFIFDLSESISNQVEKIAVYMKESENINQKKYIYVDIRIPQRLFLCWFENEFQCRTNMKNIYGENIFTNFLQETSEPQQ